MTTEDEARPEVAAFRRLAAARAAGDVALREQIFNQWQWLPDLIGRSYYRRYGKQRGWTVEDCVNQGIVGLIMAIDEYDPEPPHGKHRNTRFHTLASWRIRDELRAISPDISDAPTLVNIPALGPLEAPAWLVGARETTQPLPTLRELEQMAASGPTVEEQVTTALDGAQVSLALEQALHHLDSRQRFVIERRYGLVGDQHVWTQEEIGHALGIHRSNVCRTQQKALAVLRAHLETTPDGAVILRSLDERRQQRSKKRAAA